jgi:flotillin
MSLVTIGAIVGIVLVIIVVLAVAASRYKKVGPNEAIIATGRGGQKVVIGGGMFVMPVVQKVSTLSLQAHTVPVERASIFTKNRIPIDVKAIVVYKIKGDIDSVKAAAQAFHGKSPEDISSMIEQVAEGAFRDICGKMNPEDINEDREKFQKEVIKIAQEHFDKIGIDLISFVVTHITDEKKYFENLGVPASAEVDKDARIKKAEAEKAAVVVEAEQGLAGKKAQAENEAKIAEAQKDMNVKKAEYNAEVAKQNAIAAQAGPKQTAASTQEVVEKEITLKEKEAERKVKELLTTVVRPAEASKQAMVISAEGDKQKKILEAEGEKQSLTLRGEGDGLAAKAKGEGEAAGIKAKLLAEADGTSARAKALKEFNDAGMGLQVALAMIDKLPEIIKAAATPITAIDKMQIIDFGGSGAAGDAGGPLAKILNIPPEVIAKADLSLKTTMGIGLQDVIQLIRKGDLTGALGAGKSEVDEKKITDSGKATGQG